MRLGIEFVISGVLIIGSLLPLYIYRKKIFAFYYADEDINLFLQDVKNLLKRDYPKIRFNYDNLLEKTKNEKNLRIRETIIIENLVSQFYSQPYKKTTQMDISKDKHWSAYQEKSRNNPKFPNDWTLRKKLSWERDNQKCNRCGNKMKLEDSLSIFVKNIEDGGGYNFENIITMCSDCNKILLSENPSQTQKSLILSERLMALTTPS